VAGVHDQAVSTPDHDDDITLASYEAVVDRYLKHSSPPGPEMVRYLDRYADLVGGGHVLELGSGPGWDALHLEARGVQVTRSDATHAFLTRCARPATTPGTSTCGPTTSADPGTDCWLTQAVLLHLDRTQLEELLDRARCAVTDDGVLGFTVKEGDGSAWTTVKLDQPRHFTYWREPALRDVLTRTGWTVRHLDHVAGRHEPWLYVIALACRTGADQPAQDATARPSHSAGR